MKNKSILSNKQNRLSLERRLSLKYSSTIEDNRKSIVARRESIGALSSITIKNEFKEPRQSLANVKSQLIGRPVKKKAIMNNLINKLENEDDLKQIIESKIKKEGQRNETIFTNDDSQYLTQKLQSCRQEIDSFKDLVRHLTQKITLLEANSSSTPQMPRNFYKNKRRCIDIGVQTDDNFSYDGGEIYSENKNADKQFLDNLDITLTALRVKKNT